MKTILVSGGNRGLGLEICRQLDELGHTIILGSRDPGKGLATSRALSKNVLVKQLDINQEDSIRNLYEFVKDHYGKLDVLINNAGIGEYQVSDSSSILSTTKAFLETKVYGFSQLKKMIVPSMRKAGILEEKPGPEEVSIFNVKRVMETIFFGAFRMIQVFLPLLKLSEEGRIVNVSSGMGALNTMAGDLPAYRLSKSSLNALTLMFADELKDTKIKVNAMCPGWVRTDMGGPNAPRQVSEGADTAVWLATEKGIPSGKFFMDRAEIEW